MGHMNHALKVSVNDEGSLGWPAPPSLQMSGSAEEHVLGD